MGNVTEEPVGGGNGHAMATAEQEQEDEKEEPKEETKEDSEEEAVAAAAAAAAVVAAANASAIEMGSFFAQRSVQYGYGAAIAMATQALFIFDGKKSVQSVGHVLGAMGFAFAAN